MNFYEGYRVYLAFIWGLYGVYMGSYHWIETMMLPWNANEVEIKVRLSVFKVRFLQSLSAQPMNIVPFCWDYPRDVLDLNFLHPK